MEWFSKQEMKSVQKKKPIFPSLESPRPDLTLVFISSLILYNICSYVVLVLFIYVCMYVGEEKCRNASAVPMF